MREVARERSAGLRQRRARHHLGGEPVAARAARADRVHPAAACAACVEGALIVALGLLGGALMADLIKLLVARPRPPVEHLQAVGGYSFPSGHATQAAAFWVSLLLAVRPLVCAGGRCSGCWPARAR